MTWSARRLVLLTQIHYFPQHAYPPSRLEEKTIASAISSPSASECLTYTSICVVHDVHTLDVDPVAAGVSVVIHGHSHRPGIEHKDGVLYLNPGSAGPRRCGLPVSMALLHIRSDGVIPELVEVQDSLRA
jgi:predicted phosphodiesterase